MTLRFRTFSFWSVLLLLLAALPALTQAQDEFSLPGDAPSAPAAAPAAPASGNSSGDVAEPVEEEAGGKTFLDLLKDGGWAMWPLGLFSLAIIGLSVYMTIDLKKDNFHPEKVVSGMLEDASRCDFAGVVERAERSNTCLGRVMYGATEYISDRGYHVLDNTSIFDLMADASMEFNRHRASLINWFSVFSQAAPMVGLLGTVSGMIKAFAKLSSANTDATQLSGSISEALVTTATGLTVALPALFAYFTFRDLLSKRVAICDREAYKILTALRRAAVARGATDTRVASPPPPQAAAPAPTPAPGDDDAPPVPYGKG